MIKQSDWDISTLTDDWNSATGGENQNDDLILPFRNTRISIEPCAAGSIREEKAKAGT
jgi:hypothetical protein